MYKRKESSLASQIALNKQLADPFVIIDFQKQGDLFTKNDRVLTEFFEEGKIIIFDNFHFFDLEYYLQQPGKWFPDWIPPIFSHRLQKPVQENHVLKVLYDKDEEIRQFQAESQRYEEAWKNAAKKLFPFYEWEMFEFSYRFNHMDLGNLHLDVPDKAYEGHQFRWFINMDTRPRILAIGPTIFELAEKYWEEKRLFEWAHLPVHQFVGKLRQLVLDETIFKEREMPRHYLTLDPGSLWLAHSSYISHGLVYGRKTACLEAHVNPKTLLRQERHFNKMIRDLLLNGPSGQKESKDRSL
jgi:hypothetical protein